MGIVATYDIEVSTVPQFEEIGKQLKQTRIEANAGPEFTFGVYMSNWDYMVYALISSMAQLDDKNRFMRAIEGTPGEDIFKSISYEGLRFDANSEIIQRIPEASYIPDENPETTNYIEIQEHWVLPEYYNSDE